MRESPPGAVVRSGRAAWDDPPGAGLLLSRRSLPPHRLLAPVPGVAVGPGLQQGAVFRPIDRDAQVNQPALARQAESPDFRPLAVGPIPFSRDAERSVCVAVAPARAPLRVAAKRGSPPPGPPPF